MPANTCIVGRMSEGGCSPIYVHNAHRSLRRMRSNRDTVYPALRRQDNLRGRMTLQRRPRAAGRFSPFPFSLTLGYARVILAWYELHLSAQPGRVAVHKHAVL
jgi:hypothetical protein